MLKTKAYAAQSETSPLAPWNLDRRDLTSFDVQIEILYCGVCHSDLHTARGEWYNSVYPVVPGHEIVGKVIAVGSDVNKYTTGDIVGVGCMVDSCSTCASCLDGLEQYCEEGSTGTYNSPERDGSGISFTEFEMHDIVRHTLVQAILQAYAQHENPKKAP